MPQASCPSSARDPLVADLPDANIKALSFDKIERKNFTHSKQDQKPKILDKVRDRMRLHH